MSKLDLSVIMPEVAKIIERAKCYDLEYEVMAQMLVNAHNKKESEVVTALWDALGDWDIPTEQSEHDHNIHLLNNQES